MPCLTTKVALCNFYFSRALSVLYNKAIIPQPNYNVQTTRIWALTNNSGQHSLVSHNNNQFCFPAQAPYWYDKQKGTVVAFLYTV